MSYVTSDAFVNEISSINRNVLFNINRIQNNREVIDLHSQQLVKAGQDLTYFGEKVTELDATNQAQYGNIENVLEIALGSLVAVIAIGLLSEKNNWFNSKLQRYTGGTN